MRRLLTWILALVFVLAGLPVRAAESALDFGEACERPIAVGHHCCCDHPPEEACPCEAKPADSRPVPEPRQTAPTEARAIDFAVEAAPRLLEEERVSTAVAPRAERAVCIAKRRLHLLKGVFLE